MKFERINVNIMAENGQSQMFGNNSIGAGKQLNQLYENSGFNPIPPGLFPEPVTPPESPLLLSKLRKLLT